MTGSMIGTREMDRMMDVFAFDFLMARLTKT